MLRGLLDEMIGWLKENSWANMEPEDFDDLTDREVLEAIEKYYDGGIKAFVYICLD